MHRNLNSQFKNTQKKEAYKKTPNSRRRGEGGTFIIKEMAVSL